MDSLLRPQKGDIFLITSETRTDARSLALGFGLEAVADGKKVDILCESLEADIVFENLIGKMANVRTESVRRCTISAADLDQAAGDLIALCGNSLRVLSGDIGEYFSGDEVADVVCILSIDYGNYNNRSLDLYLYKRGYGNKTLMLNYINTMAFERGALVFATLKTSQDNSPILINQEEYGRIREITTAIISVKRPGSYYDERRMIEDAQLNVSHNNVGPTGTIDIVRSHTGEFYEPIITSGYS